MGQVEQLLKLRRDELIRIAQGLRVTDAGEMTREELAKEIADTLFARKLKKMNIAFSNVAFLTAIATMVSSLILAIPRGRDNKKRRLHTIIHTVLEGTLATSTAITAALFLARYYRAIKTIVRVYRKKGGKRRWRILDML